MLVGERVKYQLPQERNPPASPGHEFHVCQSHISLVDGIGRCNTNRVQLTRGVLLHNGESYLQPENDGR